MLQKIDQLDKSTKISDTDAVFICLYSLLLEKIEQEPNKGMVFSKGNANERRIKWQSLMKMAHMVGDYFVFREQKFGKHICKTCKKWSSISEASPHMGSCKISKAPYKHSLDTCKNWSDHNE